MTGKESVPQLASAALQPEIIIDSIYLNCVLVLIFVNYIYLKKKKHYILDCQMFRLPIRNVFSALNRKVYSTTVRRNPGVVWKPVAFTAVVRAIASDQSRDGT